MEERNRGIGAGSRGGVAAMLALLLFVVGAAAWAAPTQIVGRVVGIADGDTIRVLTGRTEIKVRLYGVDCPERKQPWGSRAKQFTADLVFGKTVTVREIDRDRYGRVVGEVILPDGRSLNAELVRAGLAWWYRRYAPENRDLEALEAQARAAGRGIWADPHPVPPWEWRRAKRRR